MVRDELQRRSPKSPIPAAREILGGMDTWWWQPGWVGVRMGRMDGKVGRLDGRPGEKSPG